MKSKYSEFIDPITWFAVCVLFCITIHQCVKEVCKTQLAVTAIEHGVIGVKK
jgi:hypothetical protein